MVFKLLGLFYQQIVRKQQVLSKYIVFDSEQQNQPDSLITRHKSALQDIGKIVSTFSSAPHNGFLTFGMCRSFIVTTETISLCQIDKMQFTSQQDNTTCRAFHLPITSVCYLCVVTIQCMVCQTILLPLVTAVAFVIRLCRPFVFCPLSSHLCATVRLSGWLGCYRAWVLLPDTILLHGYGISQTLDGAVLSSSQRAAVNTFFIIKAEFQNLQKILLKTLKSKIILCK